MPEKSDPISTQIEKIKERILTIEGQLERGVDPSFAIRLATQELFNLGQMLRKGRP